MYSQNHVFLPTAASFICILTFWFVSLKKLVPESPSKKCSSSRTPEGGRRTPQHRRERRDRDRDRDRDGDGDREQTAENKENVAAHSRDLDLFVLPPPRTPASGKKSGRQKTVLTTPTQNANAAKGHAVTPKGERSRPLTESAGPQTFSLFPVIDFPGQQTPKHRNLH